MKYRPDLDGLRAIAVGLVLIYHLGFAPYDTGQLGVLVFFVLSGFLITSILRRELAETGRVDLRRFYVRRARRLFPALAALLVVTAILAAISGRDMGRQILATAFYFGNGARAFVPMGSLEHTWSLAIEEQFYLVWPLLLVIARPGPRVLAVAAPLLVAASFVPAFYYLSMWGFAGLAVGCLLSWTRVPTIPGLSWRPLVAIGKISYGIYLWQYPVVSYLPDVPFRPAVIVVLTLAAAYVSWRLVERPFLHKDQRPDRVRVGRRAERRDGVVGGVEARADLVHVG